MGQRGKGRVVARWPFLAVYMLASHRPGRRFELTKGDSSGLVCQTRKCGELFAKPQHPSASVRAAFTSARLARHTHTAQAAT